MDAEQAKRNRVIRLRKRGEKNQQPTRQEVAK
jgi:hypothetical protein